MFFRKRDNGSDLAEIKSAMEEETPTLSPAPVKAQLPDYQQTSQRPVQERAEPAPLFVKVDKYKEVLRSLHEMRLFVSGIKQTFAVLHDIDTVRNDTLNVMRETIQRLEKSLAEVDTSLLRPRGMHIGAPSGEDVKHMEATLTDLQKQLAALRGELEGLR